VGLDNAPGTEVQVTLFDGNGEYGLSQAKEPELVMPFGKKGDPEPK